MITEKKKKIIKRLCVMDLDGCLIDTPHPETGKLVWEKHYNKPYPYAGWWGRKESLDTTLFDIKPFPHVLSQLKKEQNTPDTMVIILTSRMEKLRSEVENVLNLNNIAVDDVILKKGNEDKGDVILKIKKFNPDLEEIIVYDDFANRDAQKIAEYTRIKDQLSNINYKINYVDNDSIRPLIGEGIINFESTNKLLEIINEEIIKFK